MFVYEVLEVYQCSVTDIGSEDLSKIGLRIFSAELMQVIHKVKVYRIMHNA